MKDNNFKVYTIQDIKEDDPEWQHWAKGLRMYIEKEGVVLILDGDELKQLIKALPRTFGGKY